MEKQQKQTTFAVPSVVVMISFIERSLKIWFVFYDIKNGSLKSMIKVMTFNAFVLKVKKRLQKDGGQSGTMILKVVFAQC